jgi:poly-gamma-glutamate synthesis protein (capsule biosynthesis protein)
MLPKKIRVKIHHLLFVLVFISTFLVLNLLLKNSASISESVEIDSTYDVTLAFVGDLMGHIPLLNHAKNDSGRYNFEKYFEFIEKHLSSADFAMGNLETPIGDSNDTYTGYPRFRSPQEYLLALKNSGFDLLFLANNHILDYGEKGILKTIKHLKNLKLHYTGAFENYKDFDSVRIIKIKNTQFTFIVVTYGINGNQLPDGKTYLVNLINFDSIKSQINKAKEFGAEIVIVNLHAGSEYSSNPNKFQTMVIDSLLSFGADIIVGNHPHVLQPLVIKKNNFSNLGVSIIAYSLGNFLSNQRKLSTATGIILSVVFQKDETKNQIKLKKLIVLPTYVYKGILNSKIDCRILPLTQNLIKSNDSTFTFVDKKILFRSYELSKKILRNDSLEDSTISFKFY